MASTKLYDGRASVTFNETRHTYTIRVPGVIEKLWQPSVTGILGVIDKPALINWAVGQSRLYSEMELAKLPGDSIARSDVEHILSESEQCWRDLSKATSIGSLAHRHLHAELLYRSGAISEQPTRTLQANEILAPDFTQEMIDAANAAIEKGLQFLDEHHVEVQMAERILWSAEAGYVGTADMIGKVDGVPAILDWKTSKAIYPTMFLQLAAYQKAYQEEFGGLIKDRYVINIPKDGRDLEFEKRDLSTYAEDIEAFQSALVLYKWNRINDKFRPGSPVTVVGRLDDVVPLRDKSSAQVDTIN